MQACWGASRACVWRPGAAPAPVRPLRVCLAPRREARAGACGSQRGRSGGQVALEEDPLPHTTLVADLLPQRWAGLRDRAPAGSPA